MLLEQHEDVLELLAGLLEARHVLELGDRRGVADAGDDVFALGVDEVVAVEFLGAVGSVTGERDAGRGRVALVAEDHALDVDGSAQVVGDLVLLAVQRRARIVPGTEDGLDGELQLNHRVLRERDDAIDDELGILGRVDALGEDALERGDERLEVCGIEFGVFLDALGVLGGRDCLLELVAVDAHDDVAEHLDEAAIAVPREAGVVGLLDEALDGAVVEAEVEDGVHHAGHGHRGARADGDQQRVIVVADLLPHALLEVGTELGDLVERAFRPRVVCIRVLHAGLARNSETRGDGKADVGHLGKVGPLAAQHVFHVGVALSYVVALCVLAKLVDALNCFSHHALLVVIASIN